LMVIIMLKIEYEVWHICKFFKFFQVFTQLATTYEEKQLHVNFKHSDFWCLIIIGIISFLLDSSLNAYQSRK
jgi:hypothetical protein